MQEESFQSGVENGRLDGSFQVLDAHYERSSQFAQTKQWKLLPNSLTRNFSEHLNAYVISYEML